MQRRAMFQHIGALLAGFLMLSGSSVFAQPAAITSDTGWSELPQIPDPLGVAGPFVGVSNGTLVVAGGANFADGVRPWKGGVKTWRNAVFILQDPAGPWRTCRTPLPRPLGYGVSITTPEGVWCIGGSDPRKHFADVFLMQIEGDDLRIVPQPPLPVTLANSCGALVGTKIVVAGGIETPTSTATLRQAFVLDTAAPPATRKWVTLTNFPGPGRMLATAGAAGNDFYLFGGVDLKADSTGAPERIKPFLKDAWRLRLDDASRGTWTCPRRASPARRPHRSSRETGCW
jgi:N-acetylneuraminic acid mutarotase